MKTLKLIHTADWHLSEKPNLQTKAISSLNQLVDFVSNNQIDGILIAGDIWDRIQPFGNNSAIKIAYEYLGQLSSLVKFIFIIKGNSSHDARQSVELLDQLKPNIFAIEDNRAIGFKLDDDLQVIDLFTTENPQDVDLVIHGISYPTKSQFISTNSIDFQNDEFIRTFETLMDFHASFCAKGVPSVTLFHGNVSGARLSSGQTIIGQDIIIPAFVLEKTKSDYYALGHIHMSQNITPNMRYSGSLYNKDFGETEQKYFDLLEFSSSGLKVSNIPILQSRPMIVVEAEFLDGKFLYEKNIPLNAEVKFRYKISEGDLNLITPLLLNDIRNEMGEDVKIEANIIPVNRNARSSRIIEAKTLIEEVIEYAFATGDELSDRVKDKVKEIEQVALEEYNICG